MSLGSICACVLGTLLLLTIGFTFLGLYVDQCVLGKGNSLKVQINSISLKSRPTDNVFLGWESLFGKPADEILAHLKSGFICYKKTEPRSIKQHETLNYGEELSINTFYKSGFEFWLQESDGGFEGKDDVSKKYTVSSDQLDQVRKAFKHGITENVKLDYTVVVHGANIFQENKWFGFIAKNLCISALDFVSGPAARIGRKVARKTILKSSKMARLYSTVKSQYKGRTITKKKLYKAMLAYQYSEGSQALDAMGVNARFVIKKWALSETTLRNEMRKTVYATTGKDGLNTYQRLNSELDTWSGYMESLTDSMEFCLSEIIPKARKALYHVHVTITE
ncbi:uncharacterized protein LOC130654117 [Hydractinia symbiolongicarpus]|uniref:uncharacterized protein LOC130654117 n=1 Tax=Hydractinia symbiolongicarpus TaxID=13093 RepID=UPI00254B02F3|nr:uncharacterized protein LOC130654117 [Hydractinia symbiolongicarpus]